MKAILYIVILFYAGGIFAQSAGERPNALSLKATEAYGIKSEAKVEEFYDYLELLSDPQLSAGMKEHTANEALKLYRESKIPVVNLLSKSGEHITIKELLELVAKQKGKLDYKLNRITPQLLKESSNEQEWMVEYILNNNKATLSIKQKFYVILEDKKFGRTKKKVWNTYLGEMTIK